MIIYYIPLHKRQCLVTIIFTNLPSLHPFSFHEMIFILVYTLGYSWGVTRLLGKLGQGGSDD